MRPDPEVDVPGSSRARSRTPTPADGELLSAYLAGDLEPEEARALEQRLGREPRLAARLEDTHRLLMALRRIDEVEVPDGFRSRLHERLEAERATGEGRVSSPVAAPQRESLRRRIGTGGGSHSMFARSHLGRSRPAHRQRRSNALTAIAAAIAAFAVIGLGTMALWFGGLGGGAEEASMAGGDSAATDESVQSLAQEDVGPAAAAGSAEGRTDAAGEAADATVMEEDEEAAGAEADAPVGGEEAPGTSALGAAPETPGDLPVLRDEGVVLDSVEEARAYFTGLPEVTALLGTAASDSPARADAFRERLAEVEDAYPGTPVATCLEETSAAAGGQAVPVRLETVVYEGEPSLAFVFVAPDEGGEELNRVRVGIVDASCTLLDELEFTP